MHQNTTTQKAGYLGAFVKLRKPTISLVMFVRQSVCLSVSLSALPSVRMGKLGSHWTDFHNIDI